MRGPDESSTTSYSLPDLDVKNRNLRPTRTTTSDLTAELSDLKMRDSEDDGWVSIVRDGKGAQTL